MNSCVGKDQDKCSIDVASCINFVNVMFEGVCYARLRERREKKR